MATDAHVQRALDIIRSSALSPAEHKLLSCFVLDSVDSDVAARYVIERTSASSLTEENEHLRPSLAALLADWKIALGCFASTPKISPSTQKLVLLRDDYHCSITKTGRAAWDVLSFTRPMVAELVPRHLVQCLDGNLQNDLRQLLAAFLSQSLLQRLVQCLGSTDNYEDQLRNLWALNRPAAAAFKSGQIYLDPDPLDPSDDLQKPTYYTMYWTPPRLHPPLLDYKGRPIYSHDDIALLSTSPQTLPLPDAFLFSIHSRFCNSLRQLHIHAQALRGWPENSIIYRTLDTSQAAIYRTCLPLRNLWQWLPATIRTFVYRKLITIGIKLYGKELAWVQRVPFGLYIKHGKFCIPSGEGPALSLIERHTSAPAPRLIEVLTTVDYTYLVMTRIPGIPLKAAIHFMSYAERAQLALDLRKFMAQIKRIPNLNAAAICNAIGGPIYDYRLPGGNKSAGPFMTEEDFNDFIITPRRWESTVHDRTHEICFSHADLNPNNIIIQAGKLSGVVDFGCAGFFPEYWDYTKGVYTHFGPDTYWLDMLTQIFPKDYSEELKAEKALWAVTPAW